MRPARRAWSKTSTTSTRSSRRPPVAVVAWGLYRTRWGLRLRAVGEHPQAADTVGIKVNTSRFWNVSLAGAIAGLGGAYYTLGSVGAFGKEMTAGAGFIGGEGGHCIRPLPRSAQPLYDGGNIGQLHRPLDLRMAGEDLLD